MTVTADPNWPEIQAELLLGQTATDRPDLASCVFREKVAAILDNINKVFWVFLWPMSSSLSSRRL
jgi:hypothetical protein